MSDQRALRHIKSEILSSKDKRFFIKHTSAGSTQAKSYLVLVDMYQSDPFVMKNYDLYQFCWYILHHE